MVLQLITLVAEEEGGTQAIRLAVVLALGTVLLLVLVLVLHLLIVVLVAVVAVLLVLEMVALGLVELLFSVTVPLTQQTLVFRLLVAR